MPPKERGKRLLTLLLCYSVPMSNTRIRQHLWLVITHITAYSNRFTLSLCLPYASHLSAIFLNHSTFFSGPLRTYVSNHSLPTPACKCLDFRLLLPREYHPSHPGNLVNRGKSGVVHATVHVRT